MDPDRPVVRWTLIVLWIVMGAMLYSPAFVFVGWPILLIAFAAGLGWTAQDFAGVRHQEEPLDSRLARGLVRLELAVTAAVATACVIFATTVALRNHGRPYALSTEFVPVMLSVVLVSALSALRTPSPKRLVLVSMALLTAGPLLAAVHLFSMPLFDSGAFSIDRPLMLDGYAVAVVVLGALGIHLGIVSRRRGYGSEIVAPPPEASIVRLGKAT